MKGQPVAQDSSVESLDTMRSARRPVHPYHYTFETAPDRKRARNGSLDLGSKPEPGGGAGRNRSCSVTNAVSDMYDPRDTNRDTNPHLAVSGAVNSAATPGTGSSDESPIAFSPHRPAKRNGYTHSRSGSQTSEMSIGYASELPKPTPTGGARLSGRIRTSPLPPQLPPPSGPQPPLPTEAVLSPVNGASYERSPHFSGEIKPLPIPPSSSNLRQRVGHRLPAPLVPATPSTPVAGSVPTPQSTLPELPGKEARRPLSNRKSSTPLRGPRERGQAARTPLSAHHPAGEPFDSMFRSRSRSLSNPMVDGADPRKVPVPDMPLVNRNPRQRHGRRGSESSNNTTDSASILTTSETSGQDTSPITSLSFGEESRASQTRSALGAQPDTGRSREPHLVSGGDMIGRRAVSGSNLNLLGGAPAYYAGATPKSSSHPSADGKSLVADGGNPSDNGSSSTRLKGYSHTRSTSASGLGRTAPETSMIAVRLHYDNSRFMLRLSHATSRREFVDKIRQKVRLCGAAPIHSTPPDQLDPSQFAPEEQVSYLNDAGVFVPLDDDRDFALAWRSVKCRRNDPADNDLLILGVGPTEHLRYSA
jgi:hypothetical protein